MAHARIRYVFYIFIFPLPFSFILRFPGRPWYDRETGGEKRAKNKRGWAGVGGNKVIPVIKIIIKRRRKEDERNRVRERGNKREREKELLSSIQGIKELWYSYWVGSFGWWSDWWSVVCLPVSVIGYSTLGSSFFFRVLSSTVSIVFVLLLFSLTERNKENNFLHTRDPINCF